MISVHIDTLTDEIYLYIFNTYLEKRAQFLYQLSELLKFLLKIGFPTSPHDSFALKYFQFLSCYFIFLMPVLKFSRIGSFFLSLPSLFLLSNMHVL